VLNTGQVADLSRLLVTIMKGVTYQENDPTLWQSLLSLQSRVREYLAVLGLELSLDEAEGYAFVRQKRGQEGDSEIPRLVARRQLSYPISLLLVLLRKKLAESDTLSGDTRLILSRDQIVELLRTFLPDTANEARLIDRISSYMNRIVEMGFLRKLRGHEDQYEVRRILKAFVDAQWLNDFGKRLAEYREHIGSSQVALEDERE
jgi:hypothetical protein